jgi:hypothetical protein
VPISVINRLVIAETHDLLSTITTFNSAVDQLYLAIDNTLTALIMVNEGTLTTRKHPEKIDYFFKAVRNPATYGIEKRDFERFYKIWSKSRYNGHIPTWTELYEMRVFTAHLLSVAVTEIARFYKSDENILNSKVMASLPVYPSNGINEHISVLHERDQMIAEEQGEIFGNKLGRKLLNPWNFINISLFTDKKELTEAIDNSAKIQSLLREIVENVDEFFTQVQLKKYEMIASSIARGKQKKGKSEKNAIEETIPASFKHSDLLKFRIAFSAIYDSSEPKDTVDMIGGIFASYLHQLGAGNKGIKLTRWQLLKKHRESKKSSKGGY